MSQSNSPMQLESSLLAMLKQRLKDIGRLSSELFTVSDDDHDVVALGIHEDQGYEALSSVLSIKQLIKYTAIKKAPPQDIFYVWFRNVCIHYLVGPLSLRLRNRYVSIGKQIMDFFLCFLNGLSRFLDQQATTNTPKPRADKSNLCITQIMYWPLEKLTKPIIFVIDNANWTIRYSFLSTPLVPALCLSSRDLL